MEKIKKKLKKHKDKIILFFKILFVIIIVALFIELYKLGIFTNKQTLENFIGKWAFFAPVVFTVLRVLVSFVPIIPNTSIVIVGFLIFGKIKGMIINYIGSFISALLNFLLVRIYGQQIFTKFSKKKLIKKYRKKLTSSPKTFKRVLFLTNVIPFAPSNLFSMFAGLTSMTFKEFTIIIAIGKVFENTILCVLLSYLGKLLHFWN